MLDRRELLKHCLLCGGYTFSWSHLFGAETTTQESGKLTIYRKAADKIRPLFEKKKPPGDGDWLANQKESGQTFAQYIKSNANRRTAERNKLYLQPLGDFTDGEAVVLKILHEFMGLQFGLEVVMREKMTFNDLPPSAHRTPKSTGVRQILTTYILDSMLLPNCPNDAVAMLAITASDLWPGEGWNYVFGQASLENRVGVWSTRRFGNPVKEPAKFLRRVLQVAAHETGHMFGIEHCIAHECCMNGANHLVESDLAPLAFCCECDPKIWWACDLDPTTRAKDIASFLKRRLPGDDQIQWERISKELSRV